MTEHTQKSSVHAICKPAESHRQRKSLGQGQKNSCIIFIFRVSKWNFFACLQFLPYFFFLTMPRIHPYFKVNERECRWINTRSPPASLSSLQIKRPIAWGPFPMSLSAIFTARPQSSQPWQQQNRKWRHGLCNETYELQAFLFLPPPPSNFHLSTIPYSRHSWRRLILRAPPLLLFHVPIQCAT